MAETLLFDFGGTLDADGRPWCERFHAGYRAVGGRLGPVAFSRRFVVAGRLLGQRAEVVGFGFRRVVEAQVDVLLPLLPDRKAIDAAAWIGLFVADARSAAARNRRLLDSLTPRYELAVISNFTGNLRPCLEELGLEDCFVLVFDSGVIGVRKPDARLFHAAFDALGRAPEECWMVGDNPYSDIEPARRLGCLTCWLAPVGRSLPRGVLPTRRIAALGELPAALG